MENRPMIATEDVEEVLMEQFDKIRRNDVCLPYDTICYRMVAQKWGMNELVEAIDSGNFLKILRNSGR